MYTLIAGVAGAVLGAVFGAVMGHFLQRRLELEQERRKMLAPAYESLFDAMRVRSAGPNDAARREELLDAAARRNALVLVWGSIDVVRAWKRWKRMSDQLLQDNPDQAEPLYDELEALLRALRKDMGHEDSALAPRELVETLNWAD
jgi:hypothetical protein